MKVFYRLEDFNQSNTFQELIICGTLVFVALWVIEWTAYAIFSCFGGEIFGTAKNKTILSRHTMDFVSMATFSYIGVVSIMELGGLGIYSSFNFNGKVLGTGAERLYQYIPAAQRLIVMHIGYETKNFCDSVIHNDGLLFLVHHTCTLILCVSIFFCLYNVLNSLSLKLLL